MNSKTAYYSFLFLMTSLVMSFFLSVSYNAGHHYGANNVLDTMKSNVIVHHDTVYVYDTTVQYIPAHQHSLPNLDDMMSLDFGDDVYDNHISYHGVIVLQGGELFAVHPANAPWHEQYDLEMVYLEDYVGTEKYNKVKALFFTAKLKKYSFGHNKVRTY